VAGPICRASSSTPIRVTAKTAVRGTRGGATASDGPLSPARAPVLAAAESQLREEADFAVPPQRPAPVEEEGLKTPGRVMG
jgi:hypothetical protein